MPESDDFTKNYGQNDLRHNNPLGGAFVRLPRRDIPVPELDQFSPPDAPTDKGQEQGVPLPEHG